MPETLEDGGLLVNPFDEASIIKAIRYFELSQNEREAFGEKAFNISIKYSWKNTVKDTYSLLDQFS